MSRFTAFLALVVLLVSISGCGGGGGSFIKDVYEGSWVGIMTDQPEGTNSPMRLDFAYEGDDGFGNEVISYAFYPDNILWGIGSFYGTNGGLVYFETVANAH